MKKWKKLLITIVSVIILCVAAAASVYHFYIVPKLIEPVLETAAYILNDSTVKKEISDIAAELKEQGLLDEKTVNEFIGTIRAEETVLPTNTPESTENPEITAEDPQTEATPPAATSLPSEQPRKYAYGKKNETASPESEENVSRLRTNTDNLYERIKAEVSPEDLKLGYSLLGKLDIDTIRNLISNKSELKKYIKGSLTEGEYASLIGLYLKYSYLLDR